MSDAGPALLGIGMGTGDKRAVDAAEQATSSPLLETTLEGAHGILLSITGGRDLSLWEVNEAAKTVQEAAHPDANIIFGAMLDEKLSDEVWITVVATGYGPARNARRARAPRRAVRAGGRAAREPPGPAARRSSVEVDVPEYDPPLPRRSAHNAGMPDRARLIGINHVALEVGDLQAALDLYRRLFDFELRGYSKTMAFLEMGDQFLARQRGPLPGPGRRPPLRPGGRRRGDGARRGRGRPASSTAARWAAACASATRGATTSRSSATTHPVRPHARRQAHARHRGPREERRGARARSPRRAWTRPSPPRPCRSPRRRPRRRRSAPGRPSGSTPICAPSSIRTSLSTIARRTTALRPTSTPCMRIESSTSL